MTTTFGCGGRIFRLLSRALRCRSISKSFDQIPQQALKDPHHIIPCFVECLPFFGRQSQWCPPRQAHDYKENTVDTSSAKDFPVAMSGYIVAQRP